MADTFKRVYRGYAPNTDTTLYTVASSATLLINSIVVANATASAMNYNLKLDSIPLAGSVLLAANDSVSLDIKQIIQGGGTISGYCTTASAVAFHISGIEMT